MAGVYVQYYDRLVLRFNDRVVSLHFDSWGIISSRSQLTNSLFCDVI